MRKKINVGVIGASGFTGGEICRILLNHKHIKKIFPSSRFKKDFKRIHPSLFNTDLKFFTTKEIIKNKDIDLVFLCTKSNESIHYAKIFLKKNIDVIDLSGAFRFKSNRNYKLAYRNSHKEPKLLKQSTYGLSEFNKKNISKYIVI